MRIAMTGATGLLAGNLLLEFIKNYKDNLNQLSFILFGRDSKTASFKQRIIGFLESDLIDYLADDNFDFQTALDWVDSNIRFVHYKLEFPDLELSEEDKNYIINQEIDFFFHSAALTNMWHDEISRLKLEATNVNGTKNILKLASEIKKLKEFDYIGTAYCCGKTYGLIKPDYINTQNPFRNNYERTKLEAELLVRNFEKETGKKCRYFRPSVVSGRMIENKIGATTKFDVFYGWGAFFLHLKKKYVKDLNNLISEPVEIKVRYQASKKTGLNIVPVDYCAKIIYQVCTNDHPDRSFHLAYKKELPHSYYFPLILKSLNITGVEMVEERVIPANSDEKFYQKSVAQVFGNYMNSENIIEFDMPKIINNKSEINKVDMEQDSYFTKMLSFAVQNSYGIFQFN
jgi:nucleoside-diphosphate-sugar epimerase